MADQIPISSPTPPVSASQPHNQSTPTVDQYEKIVERSHKEIEWVRTAYKWLAGSIAIIVAVVIFVSSNSLSGWKQEVKQELADAKKRA